MTFVLSAAVVAVLLYTYFQKMPKEEYVPVRVRQDVRDNRRGR